jgi:menaquinone-9 beta-reductase
MKRTDVAVIGGGPAGSSLAILLAGAGIPTMVIEKQSFPRDKVCGEFLSWDATPLLPLLGIERAIAAAHAPSIDRCRIASRTEFSLPGAATGLSRLRFDEILFRRAESAGATLVEQRAVTSLDPAARRIVLDDGETIEAAVIAGAWGRWGRLDRELQRSFLEDHSARYFGFKKHFRAKTQRLETIDLHSFRDGYLGVSPVEDDRVNICGLVHERRLKSLKRGWDELVESLSRESLALRTLFESHEPLGERWLATEPVIFKPKSAIEAGVFLIGDAATQIDPLTGNGMAMAMQSAAVAFPRIVAALRGDRAASAEYAQAHARSFAARLAWSRRSASMLRRPSVVNAVTALPFAGYAARLLAARTRASAALIREIEGGIARGMDLAQKSS